MIYEIRVQEVLDRQWEAWLAPLAIVNGPNGETILTGPVDDQAALHGLLMKLRDLNVTLVSINSAEPGARLSEQTDG